MKAFISTLISFIDILIFMVLVSYKTLIYGRQINPSSFPEFSLLVPSFASLCILVSIACILNRNTRFKFLYICNLIISIVIICDLNYFRYFKDVISIPVIINALQLGAVESSVESLARPLDFLYTVDLFIIPFANRYIKRKYQSYYFNPKIKTKLILCLCFLALGVSINYKCFYKLSKQQPRLLTTMYNKVYITKKLGTLNYHYIDIYNTFRNKIDRMTPISKSELTEIRNFMNLNKSSGKNLHGAYSGKNLIVIQVEALQEFVINSSINGNEITPNLNRWIKRSHYFDNFHYQVASGGTSDAEFMANNSLYPAQSGAAYFLYSGNTFQSMPESFKEKGYETAAFHGFRESFWNRNVMYKNFKFDKFYSKKSFKNDEKIGLGLSDKSFLNQSIEKLKKLKTPYYAFLITLTSHYPYNDTKNYGNFNVGNLEGSLIGNYIKSIHYTDAQLGMFLDKLDKNGTLENSVVVIYGDHYAIPKNKKDEFLKFYNKKSLSEVDWIKLQKVPLIIHFPNDSIKGTSHINSGEMDIYPTISNLFGIRSDYTMGNDLFNEKNPKVIYRDGSFIDGDYYYMSENNSYYNMTTGAKIKENTELKKKKQMYLKQLQYSDDILKHNLLKNWIKQ
ncbi:LTA synthase family protein [Clostridium sp. cel8]|uniref:LTA synthase family protein n=1 Tax=Clostridium sp. cel8 TaxID=2663123 RepID=UPI0015F47FE5|nr:LTA synthase family protein [Clostridium sp. cel8]MBA5849828.1 LTA synthase family protein [Clostridium sp. cel8]